MSVKTWIKMIVTGGVVCIGGPALVIWVTPSEDELISRYNPELRKRALEGREQRKEDYGKFIGKMQEWSQSDKPMWVAADADRAKMREEAIANERLEKDAAQLRADEIRRQAMARK